MTSTENGQLIVDDIPTEESEGTNIRAEFELTSSREVLCPDDSQERSKFCSRSTRIITIQITFGIFILVAILGIGLFFTSEKTYTCQIVPGSPEVNSFRGYNSSVLSNFTPIHYSVTLETNMSDSFFFGTVAMWVRCTTTTNQIVLNSDVIIDSGMVRVQQNDVNGTFLNITDITESTLSETVTITLDEAVQNSSVLFISMTYMGLMNYTDNLGLNMVYYTDPDGSSNKMAVSSLNPSYTRRLLPCFDEPRGKATFNLTVTRPPGYVAISNMPLRKSLILGENCIGDVFMQTPKMAPNSLALVIAKLSHKQVNWRGLGIRVWSRKHLIPSIEFATSMVAPCVEALENYTGIMYPFQKLDIIAVPDNVFRRADNWGCIITNENAIIHHSNYSNVMETVNVQMTVALMVSHQWFGNLVSCESWPDLWLQEGLATFLSFTALDYINQEAKMYEIFLSKMESAMEADAVLLKNLHDQTVDYFEDPNSVFALKSAALVRMTRFFIADPYFRWTLRDLLSSKAHNTLSAQEFYQALDKFEAQALYKRPINVSRILKSWVENPNYPVILVERENTTFHLQQKLFRFDLGISEDLNSTGSKYKWIIPVTYRTIRQSINWKMTWMENYTAQLPGNYSNDSFPILNTLEQGCYRVCYDKTTWGNILAALLVNNTELFNVGTRAGLISDVFALARARMIKEVFVLQFSSFLECEREFLPWQTFLQDSALSFAFYDRMFFSTELYPLFVNYTRKLVKPTYHMLQNNTVPKHAYSRRILQVQIISLSCHVRVKHCTEGAYQLYQMYMKDPNTNHAVVEVRQTVFCEGVKQGGESEWRLAFAMWNSTRGMDPSDNKAWAFALGCTEDEGRLKQYVESIVKLGDLNALQTVIDQIKSLNKILPLLQHSWQDIRKVFGDKRKDILKNVALSVINVGGLRKLTNFGEDEGEDPGIISVALTIAKENIQWMRRNYKPIRQWLHTLAHFSKENWKMY